MPAVAPRRPTTIADHEGVEIDDATVVVLGHGLWVRHFGADPGVIGRSVTVNGHPFTVIGVAPREFAGTTRSLDPDLYLPLTAYGLLAGPLQNGHHPLRTRFFTWLNLIGRLHDGVSHAEARAGLQVVTDHFNQEARPIPRSASRSCPAPSPAFFFAATQKPVGARTLVVRTGIEPAATLAHLQQVVRSLDPDVPIFGMRTLAQQKSGSLALQRMAATLLGGFGGLALLLATLGIYGVLAYSVSRRTREIGIRMALGARIPDVLTLVMRQGLGLAGLGLVLGLAGAWAVTRLLRGFLHQVQPLDPPTYLAVMTVLAGVALLAGWLPARRAARVNPVDALRSE